MLLVTLWRVRRVRATPQMTVVSSGAAPLLNPSRGTGASSILPTAHESDAARANYTNMARRAVSRIAFPGQRRRGESSPFLLIDAGLLRPGHTRRAERDWRFTPRAWK